jgi:hypothetical protein
MSGVETHDTPPVITTEGKEDYQVDKFVDWAAEDSICKYRVRWKGYTPHQGLMGTCKGCTTL